MKTGIICLETEWEHTIKQNRLSLHTRALLGFLEKSWGCKVIYRRVATKGELQYYLRRFATSEYNDYSIFIYLFMAIPILFFGRREENREEVDIKRIGRYGKRSLYRLFCTFQQLSHITRK